MSPNSVIVLSVNILVITEQTKRLNSIFNSTIGVAVSICIAVRAVEGVVSVVESAESVSVTVSIGIAVRAVEGAVSVVESAESVSVVVSICIAVRAMEGAVSVVESAESVSVAVIIGIAVVLVLLSELWRVQRVSVLLSS
ncbi:hypothetical protein RRG08_017436 [Elysia crispata]|uniref:Uncharacterized protein n=1 Tax=Elysia crispata TaxID=231223 RepID=A0AAE1DPU1_9GAST|nr:hypothetical protein RRG08_017436 [Elysia crispata]